MSKKEKTETKDKEIKDAPKVENNQEVKKPKRFANHDLAFAYFLKFIYMESIFNDKQKHFALPSKKQRVWMLGIAHDTLYNCFWKKVDDKFERVESKEEDSFRRTTFSNEEYKNIISWDLIDYHMREVVAKTSYLTVSKRDFILEVFNWVDHFVAKEGEEVTVDEKYISEINELVDIKKIQEENKKIVGDVSKETEEAEKVN